MTVYWILNEKTVNIHNFAYLVHYSIGVCSYFFYHISDVFLLLVSKLGAKVEKTCNQRMLWMLYSMRITMKENNGSFAIDSYLQEISTVPSFFVVMENTAVSPPSILIGLLLKGCCNVFSWYHKKLEFTLPFWAFRRTTIITLPSVSA